MNKLVGADLEFFQKQLKIYQNSIDTDIDKYAKQVQEETLQEYGKGAHLAVDTYLDILKRGGKRIRGALVCLGYEMSGGKDMSMALQAARATEMLHAYILIIDDIQDRSLTRRGGPAAHASLANYHKEHRLAHNAEHFGISIALNAALTGAHAAQEILASLDATEELRLKVISIMNRTMVITSHGQTTDILNEVVAEVSEEAVNRLMEWKTAHYTILNPLHVGMVLAGADTEATDAITRFAHEAGKAFQITDDILGTFGSEFESGKSPMDDLREGKRTLLAVYALEHAEPADKNFLLSSLGKDNLTPAEFERCKDILVSSGALDYTRAQAKVRIESALLSLESEKDRWSADGVSFLRGLCQYLLIRTS